MLIQHRQESSRRSIVKSLAALLVVFVVVFVDLGFSYSSAAAGRRFALLRHRCCRTRCCHVASTPNSFSVISPVEFHVPTSRQVVRADVELQNTSNYCLCMATLCDGEWKCGLVPSYVTEFPEGTEEGPVIQDSVSLDFSTLSGSRIASGSRSCRFTITFRLKNGASVGDHDSFRIVFRLTNPKTELVQTTDWTVDVMVRQGGKPLLISEKVPFPPQEGK